MFEEILARIGECLSRHNIPYMIIGGQAVLLYGDPRLTKDIDITLGLDVSHFDKLLTITEELAFRPLPDNVKSFVTETMVLPAIDDTTGIRVDFIFSFTPYETCAIKRSKKIKIKGQEVSFASPEDLIIHKVFSGRPRDMEDIRSIILKNPGIDTLFIKKGLKEFDELSDSKCFLKKFEEVMNEK